MKQLKEKTIEFLSSLDGNHELLKGLHWSATSHAQHILTDEIDGEILEFQDKIAECVMGILDTKIGVGELKALLPNAKTLDALLKEMKKDVIDFKEFVGDSAEVSGLQNILDDLMSSINKWNYLRTFN